MKLIAENQYEFKTELKGMVIAFEKMKKESKKTDEEIKELKKSNEENKEDF